VWEILSLARHTFRESVRKKVMLVAALYVVVVLVASTLAPVYYPEARVELALAVGLKGMALFGLITIVFLAATNIPDDIREQTIYSLLTKPVTRWRLVAGRTLGFVLVAALLLLLMVLFSWAFVRFTARRYLDRTQETELLWGRRFREASSMQILKGGQIQEVAPTTEGRYWVFGDLDAVARYSFLNVLPAGLWGEQLVGELGFISNARGMTHLPGVITVTNPTSGQSVDIPLLYQSNKPSTFFFSPNLVDAHGNVLIEAKRTSAEDALGVRPEDLRLRLRPVSFEWNLAKSCIALLMGLTLAAALAVMGSTVLSSMVSICFGFFVCFLGNIVEGLRGLAKSLNQPASLILNLTPGASLGVAEATPTWMTIVGEVIRSLLTGVSLVVPDFRIFYASPYLIAGHSVPASFLGWATLYFFLYGGGALVVAWLLFRRREML
jgi:hypothetical protein